MDLCIALLRWYENQEHGSPNEAVVEDPLSLFKKVSYITSTTIFKALMFSLEKHSQWHYWLLLHDTCDQF